MKLGKIRSAMILGLVAVLASCGGGGGDTFTIRNSKYDLLNGRVARNTYRALLATSVGNLNYLETQEAVDAQHFANFVDGLLLHNEYEVLEKNLATKVTHNEDYTVFTFDVRENVPWVTWQGEQYVSENGSGDPQYVSAEDWVTSAKQILNSANASSLAYLISNFVVGAEEYYQYTVIAAGIANGNSQFVRMDDQDKADYINEQIAINNPTVYNAWYAANPVQASDIAAIASGSKLGITATNVTKNGGGTITYELYSSSRWFPTLFTYSAYMPVNSDFISSVRFANFGTDKTKILYCGPFLLNQADETNVVYVKNQKYWNKDVVNIERIEYMVAPAEIGNTYVRDQFESGNIDGFSLTTNDSQGWRNYIVGPDGTGTYEDPYDSRVNARLLDTIGNMYGTNIVMARDKTSSLTSYATGGNANTVRNTARALSIKEVREAVMGALDHSVYNVRYGDSDDETMANLLQSQYMVHTYTPKGFVIDDDGNDYVTHHLYPVYAEELGIPSGIEELSKPDEEQNLEGTVAGLLEPGQYTETDLTDDEVWALVQKAQEAISKYNAQAEADQQITYPINIEYYSMWFDGDTQLYDTATIESMNLRLNHLETTQTQYPIFNVIPTDKVTNANYETISRNGCWDYAPVQWGWGADYGDPLTYMNTFTKGGDWGDVFPFINLDVCDNYYLDENGNLQNNDLLADYTALVEEAAAISDDTNARFDLFAEAEYMLLEELAIYSPQINYGQGWTWSVSRSAGYEMPTAAYGLSNDRLTGMYVLENVLTREERNSLRAEQAENKEEYLEQTGGGSMNIYDD